MDEVVFRSPRKKGRIAVFLSGRGSNFTAIREAVERGEIDAEIALVLSNKADAPGLLKARGWRRSSSIPSSSPRARTTTGPSSERSSGGGSTSSAWPAT
jgi:folate-dependent phosphoribosylglycinamide formyltransferase PurN